MKKSGAFLVRHALEQLGVRFTFGIPGVHNTEIYDELATSQLIRPLLVTHEAGAAFMADAVSRTSDSIGTLVVVPAAGLTHAMSGIGEAFLDGIPMLVISGGIRTDTGRAYQLHQMDQQALMAPVTKAQFKCLSQADIVPTLFEAYRVATTGEPGPVYVEVPVNIQMMKGTAGEWSAPLHMGSAELPAVQDIEAAAELLAGAGKAGIFAGWGSRGARESLLSIAEMLGAPVATSLQGLSVFPHDHPLHTGMGFGPASVPAAENAFSDIDAMLAVGVRFGEIATGSYGAKPPQNLVHIDINPAVMGANFKASVELVGDASQVMPELAKALHRRLQKAKDYSVLAAGISSDKDKYRQQWLDHDSGARVNPGHFFGSLDAAVPDDVILVADDGNHTFLTAELMPMRGGRSFISPTDFNCMGYCVPATVGARLANPGRVVCGIVGDGGLMMTGFEALTAVANKLGLVWFVFADGELSQIAQMQETTMNRKTCTILPPLDIAALARSVGAAFVAIDSNEDIGQGISESLSLAVENKAVFVRVNIDYSKRTRFTSGAVKTNFASFDLPTKLRLAGRALFRKFSA
ncbi:MAG: thiamine pyrophosphate-binding protein [Proteobacteria bacterium]|nr:thiamine pyrophosphate-binding protein [Pseudomonadota bacterium]